MISVFSNDPKLLAGMQTILPVKFVRSASMAARDVSLSPRMTNTLGSITSRFRNFFLLNAGICSGTVNSIYSFLTFIGNVDKFLMFGPDSAYPEFIS
jgi:hypothetical protein